MKYCWLNLPETVENSHSLKPHEIKWYNGRRKGNRFVNVWTEETNFVCHWMDEDCIFKQDWNLQLNNSNKVILMYNKFFLFFTGKNH